MHDSTDQAPEPEGGWKAGDLARRVMWVVWPAFLAAGFAEVVFFTFIDPEDMHFFSGILDLSRQAIYTIGFFCFWAVCALSSAMTMFLARRPNCESEREDIKR